MFAVLKLLQYERSTNLCCFTEKKQLSLVMKQLYDVSVPINILNQKSQVFLFSHESFSSSLQISVANVPLVFQEYAFEFASNFEICFLQELGIDTFLLCFQKKSEIKYFFSRYCGQFDDNCVKLCIFSRFVV